LLTRERLVSLVPDDGGTDWEQKVLRDFFEGDRLKEIPANRRKRAVILAWLANHFTTGRRYPEAEVNEIIKRYHPDSATLRRELIGHQLLARERGVYWRTGSQVCRSKVESLCQPALQLVYELGR
ncbi:MAG: DUF2087 domain-containing protein, partial [Thermomicrobiales bacterium]